MRPEVTLIMKDDWWSVTGGISRFVREVAPRLANVFKVTVIATMSKNGIVCRTILPGLEVVQFPSYPSPPLLPDIKLPRFSQGILKYLERSDLVFMQDADMPVTLLRARRLKKPVVQYVHSLDWLRGHRYRLFGRGRWLAPILRRYFALWFNRADHLCVPSETLGKVLALDGVRTPSTCIPAGVDADRFSPPSDKEEVKQKLGVGGCVVIGYSGRLSREKNLGFLARVFARLHQRHPNTRLLFVGEGPARYVREFGGLPGLILAGHQVNVVPSLQAMDIYCQPVASFETSSLSTMEAMSCGLPVVVNALGCPKEYIEDGRSGYLINPPDDEDLFLDRLLGLVSTPGLRRDMGAAARDAIARYGNWDTTASRLCTLFEQYI